jgi:hypothetical protein
VGTAYRQRTQVTMFFFVFMGVGIVQRRRRAVRDDFDYAPPCRWRPGRQGTSL